jgi:hypothetical protein
MAVRRAMNTGKECLEMSQGSTNKLNTKPKLKLKLKQKLHMQP